MALDSRPDAQAEERFLLGVQESLQHMAGDLLAMESDPHDLARLERVAERLRTLREDAHAFNHDKVGQLAHLLEECLRAVQSGALVFSPEVNELLIGGMDLVEELVTSDPDWQPDLEHSEVVPHLREVLAMARAHHLEIGGAGVTADEDEEWPIDHEPTAREPEEEWPLEGALEMAGNGGQDEPDGEWPIGDQQAPPAPAAPPPPAPSVQLSVHQREFLAEVPERVQHMNESILALEQHPDDPEAVNAVFRLGHNLKGEGAMLGFSIISRLGHEMENVLARVREKKLQVDPDIVDTLFECVDTLQRLVSEAAAGTLDQEQRLPVMDRLASILSGQPTPLGRSRPTPATQAPPAAPPPAGEAPATTGAPQPRMEEAIRVNLNKLDTLINLASELLIDRSAEEEKLLRLAKDIDAAKSIARHWEQLKEDIHVDRSLRPFLRHPKVSQLMNMTGQLVAQVSGNLALIFEDFHVGKLRSSLVIDRLQEEVMKVRMLPVGTVFSNFPRVVRDIARARNKQVQLIIQGEATELDKRILEEIDAPLMHIIRNAVDHGLEAAEQRRRLGKPPVGTIHLRAYHSGNQVAIDIEDDGRGLDPDRMRVVAMRKGLMTIDEATALSDYEATHLIFRPGFSTAEVVSDISGRGVGMDVVMTNIKKIKGTLEVDSRVGLGTRFTIKLPLTLAIVEALMVQTCAQTFYIPTAVVEEILTIDREEIFTADGCMAMDFRGTTIPLVYLCDVLGITREEKAPPRREVVSLVVLRAGDATMAFAVDRVVKVQDVVIKTMGSLLRQVPNVAGATILGSGEVAVILDVAALIGSAHQELARSSGAAERHDPTPVVESGPRPYILVVEDSMSTRELMKSILETTGYQVRTAIDGVDALTKIRDEKPCLIVADIEMPRMDGFEMTRTVRQDGELRDIPIIITTVHDKEEDRRQGLRAGANAYIVKGSFDQRNLLTAIEELIGT